MTGKTITIQQAQELLDDAGVRGVIPDYDEREDDWALRRVGGLMASGIGRCYSEGTARLFAAAPDLARTVIEQAEKIRALEAQLAGEADGPAPAPVTETTGQPDSPFGELIGFLVADSQIQAVEIMRASLGAMFTQMDDHQQATVSKLMTQFARALNERGALVAPREDEPASPAATADEERHDV